MFDDGINAKFSLSRGDEGETKAGRGKILIKTGRRVAHFPFLFCEINLHI